ncbi:hypothetical protein F5887DRAFT_1002135 [Amanita rubescens]|nr:hypothetical protein F5887DRAFT_1002135 [Amanita rubescens]
MLFSYALLFFLYNGFWDFSPHKVFLAAGGGEWTRPQNLINKIKWLIKDAKTEHGSFQQLCVEIGGTTIDNVHSLTVDKKPGSDLVGTWERRGTGSRIKISKIKVYGQDNFDFDVLSEGNVNAREGGLPEPGLKDFQFNIELLTAKGGVWAEQLTFSEMPDPNRNFLSRNVLAVEYSPGGTRSGLSKLPWGDVNPAHTRLSGTWEQKATASKIEIVERTVKRGLNHRESYPEYFFKII